MSPMTLWLPADLVRDLGWTLVHFLWQGFVLAALLYLILPFCRSASARHDCAFGTLALMGLAPFATFLFLHGRAPAAMPAGTAEFAFPQLLPGGGGTADPVFQPVWFEWLVALWLFGIAVLCLRAIGGWWLTESWRRHTVPLPGELLRRCHSLRERLATARAVRFLQSHQVSVPMVVGWLKPVVLVPASAVTGVPSQQLDALILHELAHVVRLDAFANIVLVAVETILFYHPAVWWVGRRVRDEREHCCDDAAVAACGDVSTYVEALLSLESLRAAPALGLAASGGRLKTRVQRLLEGPGLPRRHSLSALVGLVFFGLVAATVATAGTAPPAAHQSVAIRVVDESVAPDARQGPPGEDRVTFSQNGTTGALWLKREGAISGDIIAEAHLLSGPDGRYAISIRLTPEAQKRFAALTQENVGRRLAVVVKNRIVIAPVIREPILGGSLQIDGGFINKAETEAIVAGMLGTAR